MKVLCTLTQNILYEYKKLISLYSLTCYLFESQWLNDEIHNRCVSTYVHNMPEGKKVIGLGTLVGVILLVDENSRGNIYLIYVIKPLEGDNYALKY